MSNPIVDNYLNCLNKEAAIDPNITVKLIKDRSERGIATYLLVASWLNKKGGHEKTVWASSESDLMRSFIKNHPEWETGSPWEWGRINGHSVHLNIYLVVDGLPYRAWENRIEEEKTD